MKKIFITLAVFFAAVNMMAQEHLSFKTKNQRVYFYRARKQYLFVYRGFYWP